MQYARSSYIGALFVIAVTAQTHQGDLFNFVPGLGACGFTNTSTQFVASVSNEFFHSFPGSGTNPNDNPICTHNLTVAFNGTNVSAQVVDFCLSCPSLNVGLSPVAFEVFAPLAQGIVSNVTWEVIRVGLVVT